MSQAGETFFTVVGCMDGRIQEPVAEFGRRKFGAQFPDTITEAGLVGKLAPKNADQGLLDLIKNQLNISLKKHRSEGVIVHGHQECAGNPVSDKNHKEDVQKSVDMIKFLVNCPVPVVGVFVKRSQTEPNNWEAEEISPTLTV